MFQKYFLCGHKWNSIGEGCRGPSAKAAQLHGSDEGGCDAFPFPGADPDRQSE